MATLGEFGSLLQLGFGIGVGLSLFRAPMDLVSSKLKSDINSEFDVFAKVGSARAAALRGELSDIQIEFERTASTLDRFHLPFMIASILTAIVNWVLLAGASSNAAATLKPSEEWLLIAVSGPIYLVILAVLALATLIVLRPVRAKLDALRSS